MKRILLIVTSIILAVAPASADTIKVVTTVPDLADMASRIGGELVTVSTIATGVEDPHSIPMKPSFAILLNRADLLIVQGLELEHSFLPGLIDASRNPRIRRDGPGYIDCSLLIAPINVPVQLDRAMGEQHPRGNPHYTLDPVLGRVAAQAIAEGIVRNYPEHGEAVAKNLAAYLAELDVAIERWKTVAAPLRGIKFVSYHPDFNYFARRYGMEQVGTIELRPGIDPTPFHIAELQGLMKSVGVKLVIRENHYPAEIARTLATQTGATLVELPIMTRGVPEARTYIEFIDYLIKTLVQAAAQKG